MRVSVVVPAYQAERFIAGCLAQLRAQTLADIEILCVDDGSTDGTAKRIHAAAASDRRIRALHQVNAGVSAARNTGIDKANGDYIAFVDVDDWLPPDALERLWQAARRAPEPTDIVTSDHRAHTEGGASPAIACPPHATRAQILSALVRGDGRYNAVWGKLYRRTFLLEQRLRMPEGVRIGEDVLFNLRAFSAARSWAHVPAVLYEYRQHAASAMHRQADRYGAHMPMLEGIDAFLRERGLKVAHYRDFLELHVGLLARDGVRRFDAAARARINGGVALGALPAKQGLLWAAVAAHQDGMVFRQISQAE